VMTMQSKEEEEGRKRERAFSAYPGSTGTLLCAWIGLILLLPRLRRISESWVKLVLACV